MQQAVGQDSQLWRTLESRELQHAKQIEELAADSAEAIQHLEKQHAATVQAMAAEAAEQARLAAQNHAREKQELMKQLMDAAFEQQQKTHTIATKAKRSHQEFSACVALFTCLEKIAMRRKARALKQWVLALQSSTWMTAGRRLAGSWLLQSQRAKRRMRDVFQAWKTYTALSALGLDPQPLNSSRPDFKSSPAKLLRHMLQYFAADGKGRLVRSHAVANGADHTPHVLIGMVFAGLTASQYQTLQPTLIESIYGSASPPAGSGQRATGPSTSDVLPRMPQAHSDATGAKDVPSLYSMAKSKPWRSTASWGGAGASLAAEGRHFHDKEWQSKRRRIKESLRRRFSASTSTSPSQAARIVFDPATHQSTSSQAQPETTDVVQVVSAENATSRSYYAGVSPGYGRLNLGIRKGGDVAVLFTEAARVVGICKIRHMLHQVAFRKMSCAWRQWVATVNTAPQAPQHVGLNASSAHFTHMQRQCAQLEQELAVANGRLQTLEDNAKSTEAERESLESITGETLLQLADAQAEVVALKAAIQAKDAALQEREQQLERTTKKLDALQAENEDLKRMAPASHIDGGPIANDEDLGSPTSRGGKQSLRSRRNSETAPSSKPNKAPLVRRKPAAPGVAAPATSKRRASSFDSRSAKWAAPARRHTGTATRTERRHTVSAPQGSTKAPFEGGEVAPEATRPPAAAMPTLREEQDAAEAVPVVPRVPKALASERRRSFSSMLQHLRDK